MKSGTARRDPANTFRPAGVPAAPPEPGSWTGRAARLARLRRRRLSRDVLTALCVASVATAVALYLGSGGISRVTDAASIATALGIVTGLIGTDLILIMLVLAARIPVIDRVFGQDVAMALHRRLGKPALYLLLAHAVLLTVGYAAADGFGVVRETAALFTTEDLPLAYLGLGLLVAVVVTSIGAARRFFPYEAWHAIHLLSYAAVLFAVPHQLSTGAVLAEGTLQRAYWIGLYVLAFGSIAHFRFAVPLYLSLRHQIRVAGVEHVAPGVVSIHLTGRSLEKLQTEGGQYAIWRFWSAGTWWHAHPISFSAVPTSTSARITVRDLGPGSRSVSRVRPGTFVSFEGPYGLFTNRARTAPYLSVVAAGIGITPVRSLLEHSALSPGEATVMLRAGDREQTYLWDEVHGLARYAAAQFNWMIGPRPRGTATWMSEEAMGDGAGLTTVFPNLLASDLYICGPQRWADLVLRDARAAGLPEEQIHIERFDW